MKVKVIPEYFYSIGKEVENNLPDPESIKHFFKDYKESKWSAMGASGAGFNIYGANNTGHLEPFESRIDIHLHLYDYPDLGVYIYYSKIGGGYSERFYSLGNQKYFTEHVENRDGDFLSKGLFVSFDEAFKVVKYFLESDGGLYQKINWIRDEDLPEEAFIEP